MPIRRVRTVKSRGLLKPLPWSHLSTSHLIQPEEQEPEPPGLITSLPELRTAKGPIAEATLLEGKPPFREPSFLTFRDQRSPDPALATHRWWSRRPPAVFRGILLSATLGAETSTSDFWDRCRKADPNLDGWTVYDPFVGGGTT